MNIKDLYKSLTILKLKRSINLQSISVKELRKQKKEISARRRNDIKR